MQEWKDELLKLAFHFTHDWNDAEEIAQTTFIKVYRNLQQYDRSRPFRPWILRIHLNNCRSHYRKIQFERLFFTGLISAQSIATPSDSSDITEPIIQSAIDHLSWKQRSVFVMIEIEAQSVEATAEMLQCASSTVRVHLMRAKQNLQNRLKKAGISYE